MWNFKKFKNTNYLDVVFLKQDKNKLLSLLALIVPLSDSSVRVMKSSYEDALNKLTQFPKIYI